MKILGIIFAIIAVQLTCAELLLPKIDTPLGVIEGFVKKSIDNKGFYAFEGVPYAQPPVGDLRFKEPQEITPWKNVWKADTIYECLQYKHTFDTAEKYPVTGQEDCLYLNIYTPTLDKNASLDVILYIHGGAFMFNHGGFYGPEILLNKNVVYVNLNYRLGPLGFLCTEDDELPGNNGLRDQIMALKWLKQYIEYFGGNPNSITIAGNSAGGASVHLHYLIPASRGLFHKGFSLSGCALNPWVLMETPLQKTKKIASLLGCPTESSTEIISCLKSKPAQQIVEKVQVFQPWLYNPYSPFAAVVDTWSSSPLIPDHPYLLLKNKQVYDVPWIISFTNSEGLYPGGDFYQKDQYFIDLNEKWNDLMPHILHYNFTIDKKEQVAVGDKIRNYYMKGKDVTRDTYDLMIQALGDRLFLVDIEKSARLQAAANKSPVYLYHFTYRGKRSNSERRTKSTKNFGAAHTDDLSYVAYMQFDTYKTVDDRKISDLIVNLWTSVAKSGIPNVPVKWPQVSKVLNSDIPYLKISHPTDLVVEYKKELGHRTFWDSLPFKENGKLFN